MPSFGKHNKNGLQPGNYAGFEKQAYYSQPSKKPQARWSVTLGGLGALRPKYKQYDFSGLPFIDIKYKRIFFLSFREGLGMNILHAPNFRTGVAFNFYGGRDEDDSDSLKGLQDIDTGFDAGAFGSITKVFSKNNISTRHLE